MSQRTDILARTLRHNSETRAANSNKLEKNDNRTEARKEAIKERKKRRRMLKNSFNSPDGNLGIYGVAISNKEKKARTIEDILESNKLIFENIHKRISCTKENNKNVLTLLPDIKMAMEIIISCIISPNKMTDTQLEYVLDDDFLLGSESLRSKLIKCISDTVEKEYQLSEKLPLILHESLAIAGSCPYLFIHEAVANDIINSDLLASMSTEDFKERIDGVMESYIAPMGFLANSSSKVKLDEESPSLENFLSYLTSSELLNIVDNPNVLEVNKLTNTLRRKITSNAIRKRSRVSAESYEKLEYLKGFRVKTEDDKYADAIFDKKEATRKGIGRPLLIKLPPESVSNIFAPGSPDKPISHIVLMDENYVPIGSTVGDTSFTKMNNSLHSQNSSGNFVNSPINAVYQDMVDSTGGNKNKVDVEGLYSMYKEFVDQEILKSMDASMYDEHVEIANREEIYYIMFCRALQSRKTNILYVPAENLVYYSLMNNEMGIGKTLLEDVMIICSIRVILLFAKVMAYTKQAIDITNINIELDPRDPNAEETFEMFKEITLKMRSNMLPVGDIDPQRITQWVQQAGLKFNVSGHPDLPEMNVTYDNGTMDHTVPDSDLDEMMAKQSITSLHLSPEMVDEAFSNNFAIEAMIKNGLVNKRFKLYQRLLEPHNTKFVRNIVYNDEILRIELKEIFEESIRDNKEFLSKLEEEEKSLLNKSKDDFFEYYLDKLSDSITIRLPSINETETDQALKEYDNYVERVKNVLDVILSADMFDTDTGGEASNNLDGIKSLMTAILVKRWASKNNYMPEVFSLISEDDKTIETTVGSTKAHFTSVFKNIVNILGSVTDIRAASDDDLKNIKAKMEKLTKFNDDKREEELNAEE